MDKRIRLIDLLQSELKFTYPEKVQIFVADDIQYQIDADESISNDVTLPGSSYGIVAPPFPYFWVEARTDVQFIKHVPEHDKMIDVLSGAAITVINQDEADQHIPLDHPIFDGEVFKWIYFIKSYRYEEYQQAGRHLFIGLETVILGIDEDGVAQFDNRGVAVAPVGKAEGYIQQSRFEMEEYNQGNPSIYHHELPASLCPTHIPLILRTINALHRKTEVIEVTHPRNFKRQMQRKMGVEPRNNYYLKVGGSPRRTYPQVERQTVKRGQNRAHFRVGHFKYYSDARPHVSGLTGMMWVNATMVHRDTDSPIDKRYEVSDE